MMRFPVSLCNHFKTCLLDYDCDKCDEYIRFIHEWQKNGLTEKMIRRTVCDFKNWTNEEYDHAKTYWKIMNKKSYKNHFITEFIKVDIQMIPTVILSR